MSSFNFFTCDQMSFRSLHISSPSKKKQIHPQKSLQVMQSFTFGVSRVWVSGVLPSTHHVEFSPNPGNADLSPSESPRQRHLPADPHLSCGFFLSPPLHSSLSEEVPTTCFVCPPDLQVVGIRLVPYSPLLPRLLIKEAQKGPKHEKWIFSIHPNGFS